MKKEMKHTATEHHNKHHRTDVPDTHSSDDHAHESAEHEDNKHSHRKEQNFPTDRGETQMKIKATSTLITLLALFFVFGLATKGQAKSAKSKSACEKAINIKIDKREAAFKPQAFLFQHSIFQTAKLYKSDPQAFNVKAEELKKDESKTAAVKNPGDKDDDFEAFVIKTGKSGKAALKIEGLEKKDSKV
jgi:hypothetical protein